MRGCIERRHSGDGDDRQLRNLLAHCRNDVETAGILQKDIDDHDVEGLIPRTSSSPPPRFRLDHLEMFDPQHHADHRAPVSLIVNNENAGHWALPATTAKLRNPVESRRTIRPTSKNPVTRL